MICNKCDKDLGNVGIYWQLKHFHECPKNITRYLDLNMRTLKEAVEKIFNKK